MNNLKILVITALIFFIGTLFTNAQTTEVLSLNANVVQARLVKPLVLSANGTALNFGSIVLKTTVGGTVILEPTSQSAHTTTFSDAANLSTIGLAGGTTLRSTIPLFTVTSEILLAYKITIPDDATVVVTDAVSNTTMTVTAFKYLHSKLAGLYTSGTTASKSWASADGSDTFALGATLTIAGSQAAGIYTGTYAVSVQYD
jgi:hypothetical protein